MKQFVFSIIIASVTVGFARHGYSQGEINPPPPPTLYAPLLLFINGSGGVSPFTNGDVLQVGPSYGMEAIPDPGYTFSSWQSVDVSVDTIYTFNGTGFVVSSVTTNITPQLNYSYDPHLSFTVSPVFEIESYGETIEDRFGWQANFEPVPEPSNLALLMCGLSVVVFARFTRCCLTPRWSQR